MNSELSSDTSSLGDTPIPTALPAFSVFGISVDALTQGEVVEHVVSSATRGDGGAVCSVNLDTLRQASASDHIAGLLNSAEIRVADGMPIVWAGRIAGLALPERVSGSNLVPALARAAAETGLRVYFLGGNPGVAAQAADVLRSESQRLEVAGVECPPFGYEKMPGEIDRIRDRVAEARPDIVFLALSFPKQEELIGELRTVMPKTWFISSGITFSFIVGEVRRAPQWMQDAGLEWLHRFGQEPRKLFRRYFLQDIPFLVTLLRTAAVQRLRAD